jgi:hypothetical protein
VVAALVDQARNDRNIEKVHVNDSSNDSGVWLPFLNRDIYTGFKPELDKQALIDDIQKEFGYIYDSYCQKLLDGTKMGIDDIDDALQTYLQEYAMYFLGVSQKRAMTLTAGGVVR